VKIRKIRVISVPILRYYGALRHWFSAFSTNISL
jgi:hypothetical protein